MAAVVLNKVNTGYTAAVNTTLSLPYPKWADYYAKTGDTSKGPKAYDGPLTGSDYVALMSADLIDLNIAVLTNMKFNRLEGSPVSVRKNKPIDKTYPFTQSDFRAVK